MTDQARVERCDYHHENQPSWICSSCQSAFCDQCVPFGHSRHWGRAGPRCPLCNKELSFQQVVNEAPPFWTQLPHFFAYPLHPNSLKVIGTVALISIALPWLSFLAILIILFLLAISVKYSFKIIENRANNVLTPPSSDEILDRDRHHLFLKMIAVVIILYGGAYVASADSPLTFTIINGIITFVLPAITIILAIEKSVSATLNPLVILAFILRVGWAYLLVWFCYQLVSSGPNFVFFLLPEDLSLSLSAPLIVASSLYFWFAAHCMLGYTVYQYQGSLGHTQAIADMEEDEVSKEEFDKRRGLAEAYIFVRENNIHGARKLLRPLLDQHKNDIELHSFFHKILILSEDKDSLENHANYYIEFLTKQEKNNLAAKVYEETTVKLPRYQPANIRAAYKIAKMLHDNGRKKEVIKILNNLHKVNVKDPDLPSAYFLLARTYSEYMNKDNQALKIIDFILDRFPKSDVRKAMIEYRKTLTNIR